MFLKRNKKTSCKIYKARPDICRIYPSKLINNDCKPEKLASDKLFRK
jgi:Fe-S-cluster containining protein